MGESRCTLNGFELTTMMAQAVVLTTRAVEQKVSEGTLPGIYTARHDIKGFRR